MERITSIEQLASVQKQLESENTKATKVITICGGTGCNASGAHKVIDSINSTLKTNKLDNKYSVRVTGCHGFCERGPLVVMHPDKTLYQSVKPKDVEQIIENLESGSEPIEKLLYKAPNDGKVYATEDEVPFYKNQQREIFGQNGHVDPTKIEDYVAIGGYGALAKAMKEMSPDEVIQTIIKSGLRGRGGGGFPAGIKWESCRKAAEKNQEAKRYVLCNADEGDPGAFMDRSLLEGNPHAVIEGMLIAAYAIGSDEGYVYVRDEYPLAVKNLHNALGQATKAGLLGDNIMGTDFNFTIHINRGGGAFVCGESTALMASIEGFVGEPRAKHIHTAEAGLYDKPTNLNNVETYVNVPLIISKGLDWYTSIGTGDVSEHPWGGSKGTKIFSLVGKVNNTGLVEVPMGMTLRQIIYDIGGGIKDNKEFKAVQTGGPSGGCIPAEHLDLPVDFDELTKIGSMMGSGGMIVMDEDTCMVDTALYFTKFLAEESCGKCVSCREGLVRLTEILQRITDGHGRPGDIELIEELCETVAEGSLCALGGSAPNPVLSTIKYFKEEYEAHIYRRECPAKVCKPLITYEITDDCTGCMVCARNCPVPCISGAKKELHVIDQSQCIKCGVCMEVCKFDAVRVI